MAAFRYWRINFTKWRNYATGLDGTVGAVRCAELQLVTAANAVWPTASMTGASSPSPFVASASGILSTGYEAWRAFGGLATDGDRWVSSNDTSPSWLQIDLGSSVDVVKLKYAPDSDANNNGFPVDFEVWGSSAGTFTGEHTVVAAFSALTTGWSSFVFRDFSLEAAAETFGQINVTLPMVAAKVLAGAHLRATLPMPLAQLIGGAQIGATLPGLRALLVGGAQARAVLPMLRARITAHASGLSGVRATLPMLQARLYGGDSLRATLPMLRIDATATFWNSAVIDVAVPMLKPVIVVNSGNVGSLAAVLPMLQAYLRGGAQIAAELPALRATMVGTAGGVARLAVILPMLQAALSATRQNSGRIDVVLPTLHAVPSAVLRAALPMLRAFLSAHEVVAIEYEAYAIRLRRDDAAKPYSVTRYTNFPFTRILRYRGEHYGVAADGIYLLGGDTDAGAPIVSDWMTHLTNFGALQKKTPEAMYLGGRMGPSAIGKVAEGEKAVYSYPMANLRGEVGQVYRVKMGKGIRSNYLGFGASDPTGGVMDIDLMDDRIPVMTRDI